MQLYLEDFENGTTTGVQELETYTSATAGITYTADAYWLRSIRCNGFILQYTLRAVPDEYCNKPLGSVNWDRVRIKTYALGLATGNPTTNRAVSSNSSGFANNRFVSEDGTISPSNGRQFATVEQLSFPVDHRFVTFSVAAAATGCRLAHPLLRFYLRTDAGTEIPVSTSAINPCLDEGVNITQVDGVNVHYGNYTANSSLLMTGSTFGIVMRNEQSESFGNDGAFDNIRVLDATPQLDKSFAPASVPVGGTSTLTLTVTNTSELAAKNGWSFTDNLPTGLVVDDPARIGGTCVADTVATAGSSSIAITNGVLAEGQESCTITVDVTSETPASSEPSPKVYENCAANISDAVGMNLPDCASVEFFSTPELEIEKVSTATADSRPGDTVEYTVTATNTGTQDYTDTNPAVVFDDLFEVLDDATFNNDAESSTGADPSFASPLLSWSGALAAGDSVSLTYSVTLNSSGDGEVRNVAWIPDEPSNPQPPACAPPVDGVDSETGEPCATTSFLLPALTIDKSADQTELPAVGDQVTYTIIVTNPGPGTYTATAPATATDDLTRVLDDATFDDASLTADIGTATRIGNTLSWSGALAANQSATITYAVAYTGAGDNQLTNLACVPTEDVGADSVGCDTVTIPGASLQQWKTAAPSSDPIVEGSTITYTLFFDNDGEVVADVNAVDELTQVLDDATVTAEPTSADGLNVVRDGAQISITGSVPAGERYTVTYTVTVLPDADRGDSIASNFLLKPGQVPPPDSECDPIDPTQPDCTVTPITGVEYTKSVEASESPVREGTELTYTITVRNTGGTEIDVNRDDDLADVLDDTTLTTDPASNTASVTVDGPTNDVLALRGTLPAGQTAEITYTVTVNAAADRGNDSVVNYLVNPIFTPRAECDPVTEDCTITPVQGYTVSKTADRESASPGDVVTYTVTVVNTGTVDFTDAAPATFTDDLSEVLDDATYNGDITAGGVVTGDELTWSGALAVDATVTVTYSVTVNDPRTGDGTLANVVVPTAPGGECESDSDCAVETPVSSFTVAKSADAATAMPGDVITYTITVINTGKVDYTDATPASFTDDLSGVLDDAVYNNDASAGASVSGSTLSWSGALPAGESLTITYSVTVDDPITGDFLLRNAVTPMGPGGSCGEVCGTETPLGSFRVVKSADSTDVVPGETVGYMITVTNTGQVAYTDAAPASFSDDLSAVLDDATYNADVTSSTGAGASYTAPNLAWSGALDVGESVTVTYSVTVNDPATGDQSLENAVVTPPGMGGNCEQGSTDPACVANIPSGSFTVEKAVSPDTALPGDIVTYTITVTNTGQVAYTADEPASFTDDLSRVLDDAAYNDDVSLGGSVSDQTLTWARPLAVGEVVQVTYSVTVDDPITGDFTLRNVVAPSSPGGECGEAGCVTETPIASYIVQKSSDVERVVLGGVVIYTVTATNTGQVAYTDANPARFTDDLSAVFDDATYNGDATNGATVTGSTLEWAGALDIGGTVEVTYSVTVNQPATGDLMLRNAVVPDGPGGGCVGDGCVTETPVATYTVAKKVSSASAAVGDRITYTVTVTNTGQAPYTDEEPASFTDDLTSALRIATFNNDATNGATYERPVLSWQGAVDVGESVSVTYSVTITEVGQIRNVVVTPGANCAPGSTDPNCVTLTTVVPPDLAITGGVAWVGGGVAGALLLALGLWFAARRRGENQLDLSEL